MNVCDVPNIISLSKDSWRIETQIESRAGCLYFGQSGAGVKGVIKVILSGPPAEQEILARRVKGIQNIVPIIDSGALNDYCIIVMPRAEKSLKEYLKENEGKLPPSSALRILIDIAEALVSMETLVIHRDFKPANILLVNGRWQISDFEHAKCIESPPNPDIMFRKTDPGYVAPEQLGLTAEETNKVTSAADIYCLGLIACNLLTGEKPYWRQIQATGIRIAT